MHINILELKAAFLTIQTFLKHRTNTSIKLRLDNTTAVAYINNKGGTRSPNIITLSLELWNWCVSRNIYIQAEHLPGVANYLADRESRMCVDSSDWRIHPNLIKKFLQDRDIDLFATRLTHQLPRYVSWHPDPHTFATDAFTLNWGILKGYAYPPPFNLVQRTLIKVQQDNGTTGQCHHRPGGPNMAGADLVAAPSSTGNTISSDPAVDSRNTRESCQPNNDPSNVSTPASSRLACFQQSCETGDLLEHVTRLLSAATRKSTNKTYDSIWRKWCGWCDRRQIDPISEGLNNILTFLGEQFENNLQYRTLNVFRSAISSTHRWVDGKPVGQHPLVIRLLKGIANERPPQPRYSTTWDVSKVTAYLSSLGHNNMLSLKLLSKKLAMLLALISPERSSVLADLGRLKKQPDGFTFTETAQTVLRNRFTKPFYETAQNR